MPVVQKKKIIKKKVRPCYFCENKLDSVDYKNIELLKQYIEINGKIKPRSATGTCARHQRMLAEAIKRARIMALLPFVE
ncbi:MAG: 30S ribosomal protein S18 [Erysipelotrichaceae bacterium]|jgi:small subunit ribosomal protein S18|nr:30S ribosomal protein S18 [Erysipelotrichaceae bacterium]